MAEENRSWGYLRIVGECRKLGITISATSVRTILRTHRLGPLPRRGGHSWTEFLRAQASGTIVSDFLTVETAGLTRLVVLDVSGEYSLEMTAVPDQHPVQGIRRGRSARTSWHACSPGATAAGS
jgi:hypothetical protein